MKRTRPLLLDLFCGAGGAAMGYWRAGFDVVGIDHKPQPRYPFPFIQGDALRPPVDLRDFDAVHASPPCQRYTRASFRPASRARHPDYLGVAMAMLQAAGRPYIVENVPGAPMGGYSVELCGLMFGLRVFRHRYFASSHLLLAPAHSSHAGRRIGEGGFCCVIGHGGGACRRLRMKSAAGQDRKANWQAAMGIDWMSRDEMSQAVPPAYTHYLGLQLRAILDNMGV